MTGKEITKAIEAVISACSKIEEHSACDDCPLHYLCLDETPVVEISDLVSSSLWDEFMEYASNADYSEEDAKAQHADFKRKYDIEERMIDDEYGG